MLIAFRKTLCRFSSFLTSGTKFRIILLNSGLVACRALRANSLELVRTIKMLFRPDFNNVSVEFAAMPSLLCGQMSWFLFGLGRRMFEENLYDAIPSIIELFLYNLQPFSSLAVEGSVFLLVKKQWRCWHHSQSSRMECLGFQLGYLIRFVSRFIFSLLLLMVIPSLWKISGWNRVHHQFVDQQAVLPVDGSLWKGRWEAPHAHLEPH